MCWAPPRQMPQEALGALQRHTHLLPPESAWFCGHCTQRLCRGGAPMGHSSEQNLPCPLRWPHMDVRHLTTQEIHGHWRPHPQWAVGVATMGSLHSQVLVSSRKPLGWVGTARWMGRIHRHFAPSAPVLLPCAEQVRGGFPAETGHRALAPPGGRERPCKQADVTSWWSCIEEIKSEKNLWACKPIPHHPDSTNRLLLRCPGVS